MFQGGRGFFDLKLTYITSKMGFYVNFIGFYFQKTLNLNSYFFKIANYTPNFGTKWLKNFTVYLIIANIIYKILK
jgi:hypothetical protein